MVVVGGRGAVRVRVGVGWGWGRGGRVSVRGCESGWGGGREGVGGWAGAWVGGVREKARRKGCSNVATSAR